MVILRFSAAARVIAKKQRVQPEVKLFTTLNVCHKAESSLPPESMRMVDHNSAAPRVGKDNVPTAIHPNLPLDEAPATPEDMVASARLGQLIDAEDPMETAEEIEKRRVVIEDLSEVVQEWIREVCIARGMPEDDAVEVKGRLYVSGSFRLGVHSRGGDIDIACVVPRMITRDDFFTSLREKLRGRPGMTKVHGIPTAAVPILNLEWSGIEVDVTFAQVGLASVGDDFNILDDAVLRGLDGPTVLSLNGPRVTLLIKELVPK